MINNSVRSRDNLPREDRAVEGDGGVSDAHSGRPARSFHFEKHVELASPHGGLEVTTPLQTP